MQVATTSSRSKTFLSRISGALAVAAASLGLSIGLSLAAGSAARASTFNYGGSGTLHTVNAGILQLDSAGQVNSGGSFTTDTSGALFSFYILDQRADYKPAGWRFLNPLAPTTVTTDLTTPFTSFAGQLGQHVTSDMAPYWMVNLRALANGYTPGAANPLSVYDILVIRVGKSGTEALGLTRAEREVLRDYVDQGGTLWIEDAGQATAFVTDLEAGGGQNPAGLFFDVAFANTATGVAYISDGDHRHPILTQPNFLTFPQVSQASDYFDNSGAPELPKYLSSLVSSNNPPGFDFLTTVIGNSATGGTGNKLPSIAAGDFGSGHIVVDDCNILGGIGAVADAQSGTSGVFVNPTASLYSARPSDLEIAYNLINWTSSESTTDGGDVRHSGAQTGAQIGSAVVGSWSYPDANYNKAPTFTTPATIVGYGTAIAGNVAYVTSLDTPPNGGMPAATLHAFDIRPQEDINQDKYPDDGWTASGKTDPTFSAIPFTQDLSAGLSYDQLWAESVGGNIRLSPPTIASLPIAAINPGINSTGYFDAVLFEDQNGRLYVADATSNPEVATFPIGPYTPAANASFPGDVPSPVYSHGWLIVPQPLPTSGSGKQTVVLYALSHSGIDPGNIGPFTVVLNGSSDAVPDNTSIVGTAAVAMVPSRDTNFGGDDLVAYVSTRQAVYPIFLGSRDEHVTSSPGMDQFPTKFSPGAQGNGQAIQNLAKFVGAPEDPVTSSGGRFFSYLSPNPDWITGSSGPNHVPDFIAGAFNSSFNLALTSQGDDSAASLIDAYVDYDVVPKSTGPQTTLSRHQINASVGALQNPVVGGVAGVAVGDDNVLYVTVNEATGAYVEAVQEQNPNISSTTANGTLVKWRYSLGTNCAYAPAGLNGAGAQIVGAPVVDREHVYVLAYNGGNAYVLCFHHNSDFYLNAGGAISSGVTLTQTDENGQPEPINQQQFSIVDPDSGLLQITDFSLSGTTEYNVDPNLSVTIPVSVSAGTTTGSADEPIVSTLLDWVSKPMQLGYSVPATGTPAQTPPGPLREFGNYLYFANGQSSSGGTQFESVSNDSGNSGTNNNVAASTLNSLALVNGPIAASGSEMVAVGSGGIVGAAFAGTMVADSNRLIEYAPDGSPMWSLDSTSSQAPVLNATGNATATTLATTNVTLSRPCSVTELSPNDILFADTGNNRCVRVDRGGNVLWELNSFNDPTGLLTPGESKTLNNPTSVVEWRETDNLALNGSNNTRTVEHFLIADAGNFRVVEIDDIYTNGTIYATDPSEYHVLRWMSHTFDKAGRNYRYVYATRYFDPTGAVAILAGVANRQIAPLVFSQLPSVDAGVNGGTGPILDSASKDTAGSSIVLLQYTPPDLATGTTQVVQSNGSAATAHVFQATPYPVPPAPAPTPTANTYTDPLNGLPKGLFNSIIYGTNAQPQTIPIRNLRYVEVYSPTGQAGSGAQNIIIADDDGVFDGAAYGDNNTKTFSVVAIPLYHAGTVNLGNRIGFYFLKSDYKNMVDALYNSHHGANPTQIKALANDEVPDDAFTPTSAQRLQNGDYLITNGATTGDAQPFVAGSANQTNNLLHFGGDVFEVSSSVTNKAQVGTTFGRYNTSPTPSPDENTGSGTVTAAPLSQPAYAVRAQ